MISNDTLIPFRMRMQMAGIRKMVWDLNQETPDPCCIFWRFWISEEDGLGVFVQRRKREARMMCSVSDGAVAELKDAVARRLWQDLCSQGWNQVSQREELR